MFAESKQSPVYAFPVGNALKRNPASWLELFDFVGFRSALPNLPSSIRVRVWCRDMPNIAFICRDTRILRIFPSRLTACFIGEPGFNYLVLFTFLGTSRNAVPKAFPSGCRIRAAICRTIAFISRDTHFTRIVPSRLNSGQAVWPQRSHHQKNFLSPHGER